MANQLIIFAATQLPWFLLGVWLIYCLIRQRWTWLLLTLTSGLLAWVIASAIKLLYFHPRPFLVLGDIHPLIIASGNSFPSGHATAFFALGAAIYYLHHRWGTIYLLGAVAISVARVLAGVHWWGDIIGGLFLGLLVAWLVHTLGIKYRARL